MSDEVAMLDLLDLTLHRPSDRHLVSQCGLQMDHVQVGPTRVLFRRSQRVCTSCYDTGVPDVQGYGRHMSTTDPAPTPEPEPAEEVVPGAPAETQEEEQEEAESG